MSTTYWYHIPTVVISWLSFFCSLYVCISAYMLHVLHKKETQHLRDAFKNYQYSRRSLASLSYPLHRDQKIVHKHYWETETLISHHIFWMTFCDTIFSIWAILTWTPQILFNKFIFGSPNFLCTISAIWVTSSSCAGSLWYLVIAYCLFCIIFSIENKCSNITDNRIKIYHSIFVWLTTIAICLIIGVLQGYGNTTNINDKECGTLVGHYQLIVYSVYIFTVTFAIILLISVIYKVYVKPCIIWICCCLCYNTNNENSNNNNNNQGTGAVIVNVSVKKANIIDSNSDIWQGLSVKKMELVLRLTEFTIVFIIVWIFPIIDRIHRWMHNDKSPIWMEISHNWFLVSIGLGNAIVWMRSKSFQSFYETKKLMKRIDDFNYINEDDSGLNRPTSLVNSDTISFKKRMLL